MKHHYWIRRDADGIVTAGVSEQLAPHDLLMELREMASIGPIERVCVDVLTIGKPLPETPPCPYTLEDWKFAVMGGVTVLGYEDWIQHCMERDEP